MHLLRPRPLTFVEARVVGPRGIIGSSLRLAGGRIEAFDCLPQPGDAVMDLQGALVLPGLINAHDHLELNNFPRSKWRDSYINVRDWIADFQPRFQTDPALSGPMSVPLADRLLLGGMKNLLSGVTTVCHHNPLYRGMKRRFPVRVIRQYRYSHSLLLDGEAVRRECEETPDGWPWIIHAAEGTDSPASCEFELLNQWHCIGPKSILVHGVGMGKDQIASLIEKGGALIWCPSSNDFLLGATIDVSPLLRAGRVALGTDSRLSGTRDLLEEMSYAAKHHRASARDLLRMVTADAARMLQLSNAGELKPGVPADLTVIPAHPREPLNSLLTADRTAVRLVILDGRAQFGDVDLAPVFAATGVRCVPVCLDRREKLLAKDLAERMRRCSVFEPGLEI